MRIGSVSGIAGRRDSSLIRPVPDDETLPLPNYSNGSDEINARFMNNQRLYNMK